MEYSRYGSCSSSNINIGSDTTKLVALSQKVNYVKTTSRGNRHKIKVFIKSKNLFQIKYLIRSEEQTLQVIYVDVVLRP